MCSISKINMQNDTISFGLFTTQLIIYTSKLIMILKFHFLKENAKFELDI